MNPIRPHAPPIERLASAVVLSKLEVFEVCEAIADAERILLRSGNASEAARLAALFELVESRLVLDGWEGHGGQSEPGHDNGE